MAFNYTVIPPVSAVNQGPQNLCWLASTSVLFSWRERQSVSMQEAANRLGIEFIAKYGSGSALRYDELSLWANRAHFRSEAQQCIAPQGWDQLLRRHGPLITLVDGDGAGVIDHAVVVFGIVGDGTANGTNLKIANGQGGVIETYSLTNFVTIFELPPGTDQLFSVSYFR